MSTDFNPNSLRYTYFNQSANICTLRTLIHLKHSHPESKETDNKFRAFLSVLLTY